MAKRKPKKPAKHQEMDIDQKIRINELKESIKEVVGQEMTSGFSGDCPPDVREQFLESVLAYEKAAKEETTASEMLKRNGLDLPPEAKLSDAQIAAKLKEIIARLAKKHVFVSHTNHLTDRQFYTWLLEHSEGVPDFSKAKNGAYFLDIIGSYGKEEIEIYDRFYATEKERRKHKKEFPNSPLPPREKPVSDRDKTLPTWDPWKGVHIRG